MRLPPMPSPGEIVRIYGLSAKRKLAQNFLLDCNVAEKFVRLADPFVENCFVCEVGPGPGSLTRSILMRNPARLVVVEKDSRFLPAMKMLRSLRKSGEVRIVWGDVLKYKMETAFTGVAKPLPWEARPNTCLISNLPFNISTPLIIRLMRDIANRDGLYHYGRAHMVLSFQKEVAERMMAPVCHAQRSRLSVMVQTYTSIVDHFLIPGSAFVPAPKVDAAVLKFVPLVTPRLDVPFDDLEMIVRVLFSYRRALIRKAARQMFRYDKMIMAEFFQRADVPDNLRPQEVTLDEWGRLCRAYIDMKHLATGIINFQIDPVDAYNDYYQMNEGDDYSKGEFEPDTVEEEAALKDLDMSPLITQTL
ncbi:dimethyladenosine transferase 1, mitochondrial-like [Sycon ciliatum]|uniref:dimethyladenosine transferase 1, mitochondrial-like n=1 Tax=Sycon ciliatum TaxID=27933 RepID=UPI0020A92A1F|eukprot:scpid86125/ scgid31003/ Dimethyladenosine transferase 1, mitochondrial; Mitochondrial 12S rRNA dimethylase 1; Mitochondrial transcription factor B1; S-adenosylmethionine-6-N&apos